MDEDIKAIVSQVVKEAVKEALKDMPACTSQLCKEHCGMTHIEHAQAHERINCFFDMLSDTSKSIRLTIVKILVTALVGATIIGMGIKFKDFL